MLFETAIMLFALSNIPQPTVQPKPADVFALFPVEERLATLTNAQRARYGLHPLKVDVSLMKTARNHAIWMSSTGNFRHTSIGVGENIAMGQPTTGSAMQAWMNSSGHRANILSRRYTRLGVAGYVGRNGAIYWCQQFR